MRRLLPCLVAAWLVAGCDAVEPDPLPDEAASAIDTARFQLLARFVQISDAHVIDEESPGRFTALAALHASAWRPQERYSIHLLDGMIRAVNAYHERVAPIDFLVHTGDGIDNAQFNELRWLLDCFDGKTIDPLSGVDDRLADARGPALLDAHAPFRAEGLYRNGVHGEAATIPWYTVMGNHERYAVGIFPIVPRLVGGRMAPLPVSLRIGLFLPVVLVPDGPLGYGPISPAHPGPPPEVLAPTSVLPNPDRRFVTPQEIVDAHLATLTSPPGHGFAADGATWYAISPVPGLRLVVLDTTIAPITVPTGDYHAGGITLEQLRFLRTQLAEAEAAGDRVIVVTHHPSADLSTMLGTSFLPYAFRELLSAHRCVIAHLAGHTHRNRVWDRGGYLEFETSAILDDPQQGRIIEVWTAGDETELRHRLFSHRYTEEFFTNLADPPTDPLLPMRQEAYDLAVNRELPPLSKDANALEPGK